MARKPWPMRWIVLAIVLFVVPYTYLTLRYRKPTSFEPYEDARERKHLAGAGYARTTLRATPLPEPLPGAAAAAAQPAASEVAPGGLPRDLAASLIVKPVLPGPIQTVWAPAVWDGGKPYVLRFRCVPPPGAVDLAGAHLYRKGADLFVVVGFAPLADGLERRKADDAFEVTFPIAAIDPGVYRLTLVGSGRSLAWPLQVH